MFQTKHQSLANLCVGFIAKLKQVHSLEVLMPVRIDSFRFGADGMEHAHIQMVDN